MNPDDKYKYWLRLEGPYCKYVNGIHSNGHMYQNIPVPNNQVQELIDEFKQHHDIEAMELCRYVWFTTEEDLVLFRLSLPNP